MSDRLKKAKALAALEHGVLPKGNLAFHAVKLVEQGKYLMPREVPVDGEYDTPIDALAAAADALGLSPDPDVMREGLTVPDMASKVLEFVLAQADATNDSEERWWWETKGEALHELLTRLQQKGGAS